MKIRAEMKLRDETVDFIIELKAFTFKEAMSKLTHRVLFEFDHSFSADNWGSVSITILRDE